MHTITLPAIQRPCARCGEPCWRDGRTKYCGHACARAVKVRSWRESKRRKRPLASANPFWNAPPAKSEKAARQEILRWSREESKRTSKPRWQILQEMGEPFERVKT